MAEEETCSSSKFKTDSGGMTDQETEQNQNTEIHVDNGNGENTERENELIRYLPLYGAALEGDWDTAKRIFDRDPTAMTAKITYEGETALHLAVSGGNTTRFVSELVNLMPQESLEQLDDEGRTALHHAAATGNTKAAKILVKKNPRLTQIWCRRFPLHVAAEFGHRDTFLYLLSVTKDDHGTLFTGNKGISLILDLIKANLNGTTLDLLNRYPNLAHEPVLQRKSLHFLAGKASWFASGSQLGYCQRLLYHCIPIERHNFPAYATVGGDIETSIDHSKGCFARFKHFGFLQRMSTALGSMFWRVNVMFWNTIIKLVPAINYTHDTKLMHWQTLALVKLICAKVTSSHARARECLRLPLFIGIDSGIHELAREIIKTYPPAGLFLDYEGVSVFQNAVLHRQEKVLSLIYQMGLHKHFKASSSNIYRGNNVLHYAAKLKPSSQVSGAALQMQRELQWFKVVETMVQPSLREEKAIFHGKYSDGVFTPRQIFTSEHAPLAKEGEDWMKDIASSCSFVAALIATVVFAAAFTVPGGNNSDGKPICLHEVSFMIFAISDALALFSSTTSVLMFLGILTSRYSQEGFLESLPRKLIIALVTLFISIASMVVAFGAALHIVLVARLKWVVFPIALFACLPVTLFAWLQFPLLVELIVSTYRPSILRIVK